MDEGEASAGAIGPSNPPPTVPRSLQGADLDQVSQPTEAEKIAMADNDDGSDDSDSDISMSNSNSDEEELKLEHGHVEPDTAMLGTGTSRIPPGDTTESKKRKSPGTGISISTSPEPSKKLKLDEGDAANSKTPSSLPSDKSLLPAEIWHHIFTLTPPRTLGNLLQVNKLFSSYLDPSFSMQCSPPQPLSKSRASILRPEAIWQASRRRFWSKMPTPLRGKSELDMWRLACVNKCQYCGKPGGTHSDPTNDKTHPGPGTGGIRIVWPFAARSCGSCLISNSVKEIDLLLSPTVPSLLLPALSFVLITNEMHVLSSGALLERQSLGDVQYTKIFMAKNVEELKVEFESVKLMGAATTEEWLKGLEDRGKEHRTDSTRWEKWEAYGGVAKMQGERVPGELVGSVVQTESTSGTVAVAMHSDVSSRSPIEAIPQLPDDEPFSRPFTHPLAQPPRVRTLAEVDDMKAARRAEIERRALLLDPPLPPNVLAHIPSFQAATQIIHPFDDSAWDVLAPRLLAQRAGAEQREQREQEVFAHSRIVQERSEERRNLDSLGRESKELIDKDWDDAQAPLRAQISAYADETIRDGWDSGRKVKKDSSPQFAVEVLLYVRMRFYAEVAKDAAAARAAGQEPIRDPPGGPFTQKLTLENMKWLFDTKIKPHTESFRKELFLCNGCDGNGKAYGFEGVIQHYAAKHTNTLSLGSVVVHWRSEWPEKSPFHPSPLSKTALAGPTPGNGFTPNASHHQYGYNQHAAGPPYHQQPPPYTGISPPTYSAPTYPNQYGPPPPQHGGYGPQGAYPPPLNSYGQYPAQPAPYTLTYTSHPNEYPVPPPVPHYPPQPGSGLGGPPPPAVGPYGHNYAAYQGNGHVGYPQYQDKIRAQHDDISHNSREVWMATSGLKELPGNIRVYVVLHHLAKRYRSRFSESPSLRMFIDGLSNNKDMRPVRNVNGLMCKACQLGLHVINGNRDEAERSTFSLPQLVNHFQQRHIEPLEMMGAPLPDWTIDMVFVPELSSLSNLRSMSGMDSHKYAFITEAFPQAPPSSGYHHPSEGESRTVWAGAGEYHGGQMNNMAMHSTVGEPVATESAVVLPGLTPMEFQPGVSHNPRHDEPPPVVDEYDPHQPSLPDTNFHPSGSATEQTRVELLPSAVVYGQPRPTQIPKSHSGSGNTSPDIWQPPTGKNRNRKGNTKDQRSISERSNKNPAGGVKSSMDAPAKAAVRYASEEADKVAQEEAQRQEEEIRAMWAADRRETARLYTTAAAPQMNQDAKPSSKAGTPSAGPKSQTPGPRQVSVPHVAREDRPSPLLAPKAIVRDQDDDLFAGLEYHLAQQKVASHYSSQQPISERYEPQPRTAHKPEAIYERRLDAGGTSRYVDQQSEYEIRLPRSGMEIKYETREPSERYQERNPAAYPVDSAYSRPSHAAEYTKPGYSARPTPAVYEERYERIPREEYYRTRSDEERRPLAPEAVPCSHEYADERRTRPIQYTESYELIKVRDSRGEYYIERPIRREAGPAYAPYEDERYERPVYREAEVAYDAYEQSRYPQERMYEAVHRPEPAPRLSVYETRSRSDSAARQVVYEGVSRPDAAASYEEYDPRFPAAPSRAGGPRQVRYQ